MLTPKIVRFGLKVAASFLLTVMVGGCYIEGGPSETQVYDFASEVRDGNLRFGLPSVSDFEEQKYFGHGKKAHAYFPEAQAFIIGSRLQPDGALSSVRDWTIVHNTFKGTYDIRSGPSTIGFQPPFDKTKPTAESLRQMFGRWIIFPGDDMRRVHEVHGDFYPQELIFNDGRSPADTYKPDL